MSNGKPINLSTPIRYQTSPTEYTASKDSPNSNSSFPKLPPNQVDQIGLGRVGQSVGASTETCYVHHITPQKSLLDYRFPSPMLYQEKQDYSGYRCNGFCCNIRPDVVTDAGRYPYLIVPQTYNKPSWRAFFKECWYRKIRK